MKSFIIVLSLLFVFACSKEDAKSTDAKESMETVANFPKDLNTECPVSGEEIDPADYKVASIDEKNYAVCCNKCKKKLEKNPAKYLAELNKIEEIEKKLEEKEAVKEQFSLKRYVIMYLTRNEERKT